MNTANTDVIKKEVRSTDRPERTRTDKIFIPHVDIIETKDTLILNAEMPGLDKKSIDILLEKDVLTIKGNAESEENNGYTLNYREYETGGYERTFVLNESVDREKIEAEYQNGILKVTLPKSDSVKPKKIEVKLK